MPCDRGICFKLEIKMTWICYLDISLDLQNDVAMLDISFDLQNELSCVRTANYGILSTTFSV